MLRESFIFYCKTGALWAMGRVFGINIKPKFYLLQRSNHGNCKLPRFTCTFTCTIFRDLNTSTLALLDFSKSISVSNYLKIVSQQLYVFSIHVELFFSFLSNSFISNMLKTIDGAIGYTRDNYLNFAY